MYPEKAIFDVAGFPAIKGRDLVDQLLAQAAPFKPNYMLGHQAVGLERGDGGFAVTTASGHRVDTRAIVITGGVGTLTPPPPPTGGGDIGRGPRPLLPRPRVFPPPSTADGRRVHRPWPRALRARSECLRRPGHRGGRRRRLGPRLGPDARADRPVGDRGAPPGRVPRAPALGRAAEDVVGADHHR